MIKLSKRLAAVADFAAEGKAVADVGTDHGHIPVWFAQRGTAARITASDINEGPLENARRFAAENGVADRIDFVLTDGLRGMGSGYDTVIIAGMGGETIISILSEASWTKNGPRLVLQPQTKTETLVLWLYENGYAVEDETLVKDAGKFYAVFAVRGGEGERPDRAALYAGGILFEKRDPLLPEYLDMLTARFTWAARGLEKGGRAGGAEYAEISAVLAELETMKEETDGWQK